VQRVLDPAQIEAFAERDFPRLRLPGRRAVFSVRAQRLRQLSSSPAAGHGQSIAGYLRLMALVADAQQAALGALGLSSPSAAELERARTHGMPLLHAPSLARDGLWRGVLGQICNAVLAGEATLGGLPQQAVAACTRLLGASTDTLETQADAVLTARSEEVDAAVAPFISAALQVVWLELASRLSAPEVPSLSVPGVCPVCGALPVASIVGAERGYRYLHCPLCATAWHLERVKCSHCQATEGIGYYSIEGGPATVRAEACPSCHSYRKILYQEKDMAVEPVADDLASLALDLLMSSEGFHRASGNPLLWLAL